MKKDRLPFAVYTKEIVEQGRRPYITWHYTAKQLQKAWFRHYGIEPTKIVPAYWDIETGDYLPEE